MTEKLGKIESVIVGWRCEDSPFGVHFTLSGSSWGVSAGLEHFGVSYDLQGMKSVCALAKVSDVYSLKNTPIRAHFESNMIKKVEILEEVL